MDDFAIGTQLSPTVDYIWNRLDEHFLVPIKRQGLITHFNGIDVEQMKYYIKISVGTYPQGDRGTWLVSVDASGAAPDTNEQ